MANVRVIFLLIVFGCTFFSAFESSDSATVQLPHLVPSPPMANHDKEKQRLEARCPPLDPCKMGHYYMELFDKVRIGVNCPPQPQRCSTTTSTTDTSATAVTQLTTTTEVPYKINNTVLCQYLAQALGNKVFLQMYVEVLKVVGCPIQPNSTSVEPVVANVTNTSVLPTIINATDTVNVSAITANVTDTSVADTGTIATAAQ